MRMMIQPDLGKKIAELRKSRGLTQEELVELCNISVRTLQRIETGEVTPRSYTVKTILGALDYDLSRLSEEARDARTGAWWEKLLLVGDGLKSSTVKDVRRLNLAWIAGVVYFFLGFPESVAEYFRIAEGELIFSRPVYIALKVACFVSYFFFIRGFVVVGSLSKSALLKITAILLICATAVMIGYDIASVFYDAGERMFLLPGFSISFGALGFAFGIALFMVRNSLGYAAAFAGIFEVLAACFFMTVVLSLVGLVLLTPAEILEIILLYKAAEKLKAES